MSGNHLQNFENAVSIVRAAAQSGASAIKFQHYLPETITAKSQRPEFFVSGQSSWTGKSLWELYESASTPWEWTEELIKVCDEENIIWFSSPFDESAVEFLEQFDPPMYKIASFEIVDIPLVEKVALTGKPLIISTGMASEDEISEAVEAARRAGNAQIALLRTNSAYPAPVNEMDLRAIPYMAKKWGVPIGLSDHTLDNTSAIVATALGAGIFEKHLTLRRSDGGPDAAFSLEPEEFTEYARVIRDAFTSLGTERFGPGLREGENLRFRPSVRAVRDIAKGEVLSPENVATLRPAGGLHPRHLPEVLGCEARIYIEAGEPIRWDAVNERV